MAAKDSIFRPTYQATIDTLRKTAEEGGYDVILEVGCGTGDIIGEMNTQQVCRRSSLLNLKGLLISPDDLVTGAAEDAENFVTIPCIGVDINKEFVDFCKTTHRKFRIKLYGRTRIESHRLVECILYISLHGNIYF